MAELFRVAVPLMISAGSQSLMNAADRMVLAGCSQEALAAVTPASMLHWTCVCIPLGTVLYANTFISQYEGAGRKDRMMTSLWQAIWIAIAAGILLLSLLPLTRQLLELSGHPPKVAELEAQYFNTLAAGNPILLVVTAMTCFFNGRRKTSVVMIITMGAVVFNFVVDYLLVYGVGPFPELGIRGAALATVLARCCEVVIYGILIWREAKRLELPLLSECRIDRELLWKYFRFGIPSGLHYFVDYSGFTVFLMLVGTLSSEALAATNLAFSVNGLIFVPLLGFGTAIQTLVGHHMGARRIDWARQTTRSATLLGILWTGGTGLLLIVLPQLILRPFAMFADEAQQESLQSLSEMASTLLYFVAVYSIFDALAVVYSSALRGAGDTMYPMVITLASTWLVMVLPAAIVVHSDAPSLMKLWFASSASIIFTGSCMLVRYLLGRWTKIELVKDEPVVL